MRRLRSRPVRWAGRAVIGAAVVTWVLMPTVAPAQDTNSAGPVSVTASIAAEASTPTIAAIRVMDAAERPTEIQSVVAGSEDARRAFVSGASEMLVSGVGLSAEDRKQLEESSRGVIEAPVQAVGLQLFGFVPTLQLFPTRCDEVDEFGEPLVECGPGDRVPYTGPIRFAPDTLASLAYRESNIWESAGFVRDTAPLLPAGFRLVPPFRGPRPLVRSDADAFNLYLDRYLAETVGQQRRDALSVVAGADAAAAPSETWPIPFTPSRQGMDNVVSQIREGLDPGSSETTQGGAVAAAGPSFVNESFLLNAAKPAAARVPLFRAGIRNGAGQWLAATPEAITAAVAAGNGAPLTGATTAVPGAYPITWVNRAYAPASGLTAGEANAVATYIRIQVTKGRAEAAGNGDGQITPKMVEDALAAADEIVTSNCRAAKGTLVTSRDGTPYAPAGTLTFGSMKYCEGDEPQQDVAADGSSDLAFDTGSFDTGSFDSGFSDTSGFSDLAPIDSGVEGASLSADGTAAASGVGAAGGGAGAGGAEAAATISRRMPFGIPGQTLAPLDRVVTLGLGALSFLFLRNRYLKSRPLG